MNESRQRRIVLRVVQLDYNKLLKLKQQRSRISMRIACRKINQRSPPVRRARLFVLAVFNIFNVSVT